MSDGPTVTLTGRWRHKAEKRWFRKEPVLVLQVEKRHKGFHITNNGGVVDSRPYDFKLWHDAKVEDLRELEL